ncbi:MAG TPA: glycoside hydrolase family 27 protein [Acidisarcina sp.]
MPRKLLFRLPLLASALALVTLIGALSAAAQQTSMLAPTPPMGWNSWDSYGFSIDEATFKANTEWLNTHLKQFGWNYVVIDEGWYLKNPASGGKPAFIFTINDNGLLIPDPARYPDSVDGAGFKPIGDYVHSLGLKFGLHIIHGIPREVVDKNLPVAGSDFHAIDVANKSDICRWNADNYGINANAAGQAYYDSLARMYAGWGLDFLKVDCISQPYHDEEIHMLSEALRKSGRPIVLSLSPGPTPVAKADDVKDYAEMWRISDDFWDFWSKPDPNATFPQSLKAQFDTAAAWAPHVVPGHWPDADMLPIGHIGPNPGYGKVRETRLTHDEQRTLLTAWSIFRSPLVLGANLTQMDDFTTSLLTDPEVIAVDQHSTGNHPVVQTPTAIVWKAQAEDGKGVYLAVFNTGDTAQTLQYAWKDVELDGSKYHLRDLWLRKDIGSSKMLKVTLDPHASAIYRLTE